MTDPVARHRSIAEMTDIVYALVERWHAGR